MRPFAFAIAATVWLFIIAVEATNLHGLSGERVTPVPTLSARDVAGSTGDFTTITETEFDGATATMTFSKTVLSEYTDLLEKITITTVIPTTTCENVTAAATATATSCIAINATSTNVIWPGGIVLIPEIPGLLPPTIPGEGEDEGEKCPNEKPKCSDLECLGIVLQMCTLPPLTGCSCEEQKCPEEEIYCWEAECSGSNGKCTVGDYKDCDCAEEDCPEGEYTLECDQCGGQGSDWNKCAGKESQNQRYKGCGCSPYPPETAYPGSIPFGSNNVGDVLNHLAAWSDNWDLEYIHPVCKASLSIPAAPQRPSDGNPNVQDSINSFCKTVDGKQLSPPEGSQWQYGKDQLYGLWKMSNYTGFWLSATWRPEAPKYFKCGKVTIEEKECVNVFTHTMITCDPNSGGSKGGAYGAYCIDYNITVDQDYALINQASPPWNRLPDDERLGNCTGRNPSGVEGLYWRHIFPTFCKAMGGQTNKSIELELTTKNYTTNTNAMPPPPNATYPDQNGNPWRFNFRYTPTEQGGALHHTCQEAYDQLADSRPCGKGGQTKDLMARYSDPSHHPQDTNWKQDSTGYLNAGGGIFSFFIDPPSPNESQCEVDDLDWLPNPVPKIDPYFYPTEANEVMNWFCSGEGEDNTGLKAVNMTVEPNPSHPPDGWQSFEPDYPERMYYFPNHSTVFIVHAAFADVIKQKLDGYPSQAEIPTNAECNPNPPKAFNVRDYNIDCNENLFKAMMECNNVPYNDDNLIGWKTGARSIMHEFENGCVVWTMYAVRAKAGWVPDCVLKQTCYIAQPGVDGKYTYALPTKEYLAELAEQHPESISL